MKKEEIRMPNEYKSSVKALILKSGNLLVNYHGMFFFTTQNITYLPWIVTQKTGRLVPSAEYARLRKEGCKIIILDQKDVLKAYKIAKILSEHPKFGLSQIHLDQIKKYKIAQQKKSKLIRTKKLKKVRDSKIVPIKNEKKSFFSYFNFKNLFRKNKLFA